jgi:hypothetical protein
MTYKEAVRATWRHAAGTPSDRPALLRELVRYATLASSSHNTQCWKFKLGGHAVSILPDLSRRCPAVDPDDHHLFASLGCAAENLVLAAEAFGLHAEMRFAAAANDAVEIALAPAKTISSPLFEAIPLRQCTRTVFDGKPLPHHELELLEQAGSGNGVRVLLVTGRAAMERVLDYVVQGNGTQMNDPAFVKELKAWIRFSAAEAVRSGDGLFGRSTGNPAVPRWLGSRLFSLLFTAKRENDKYTRQVRSSAGIAVFASVMDDKAHWVEAGRCYQRFALQATALEIRTSFLNQPVEVSALRPLFASDLGLAGLRPDLVVRFGRGPQMPRSLRRPVEAVLA